MNLDAVARLIEASSLTEFRNISHEFLQLIGLRSATYCDGPYDGGTDFSLPAKGELRPAVQISVEADWRSKLQKDVLKLKKNYNSNLVYFLSSRRIPENSFESIKNQILDRESVTVTRYDNQAIATTFLKECKINKLLNILGIDISTISNSRSTHLRKYMGASTEAVSALLIFGDDAKSLRNHIFSSLIKSELAHNKAPLEKNELIKKVIDKNGLSENQTKVISSHLDRLIQSGEIHIKSKAFRLSEEESQKFTALAQITDYEAASLLKLVTDYITNNHVNLDKESRELIVSNLLELAVCLIINQFSDNKESSKEYEVYKQTQDFLIGKIGIQQTNELLRNLTEIVADSTFAKHVVAAKLYTTVLNSNSEQLVLALGGRAGATVFFDSSVVIPMLCGLVFDTTSNRSEHSARLLYDLLKEHEFTGIVPKGYVEEVAAHLIEACRDYAAILQSGEKLSKSDNAFVSHFSKYSQTATISFDEYAMTFGVRLSQIQPDLNDSMFYAIRDKAIIEISALLARYSINVNDTKGWNKGAYERLTASLSNANISRPDVLIGHDAAVISYLSSNELPSDQAKILCTWDKIHYDINPDGAWGYIVMTPLSTIDLFAIAKGRHTDYPLSTLLEFAKMQTEDSKAIADQIWDSVAGIEQGALSDARLLSIAKKFKEKYVIENGDTNSIAIEDIPKAWLAWKNSH